jgi:pimeloyl-ACP methyl ester carboxylesterase
MMRGACVALILVLAAAPTLAASGRYDQPKKLVHLSNGIRVAYIELGDRRKPPLIVLHGITNSARGYLPLGWQLAGDHHVLLLDMRGHGASSKPACCYSRLDFAYDIKLLMDQLHIARADIAGHSLGSIVAQTFAEYWPERTQHLVLIASTVGRRSQTELPNPPPSTFGTDIDSAIAHLQDPIDPDSTFMREWWNVPGVDPVLLAILRRESAAIPAVIWRAMLEQLASSNDLRFTMSRIKAPTLLVFGGKDSLFGAEAQAALKAQLPAAKVALFPDLGHSLPEQDPAAVAAAIHEFLAH